MRLPSLQALNQTPQKLSEARAWVRLHHGLDLLPGAVVVVVAVAAVGALQSGCLGS